MTAKKPAHLKKKPGRPRKYPLPGSNESTTSPSGSQESGGIVGGSDPIKDSLFGGSDFAGQVKTDSASGSSPNPLPEINYAQVIKIVNIILSARVPEYAMLAEEEKAIGESLDLVIKKHFPSLANLGAEAALAMAVAAYVFRAFSPLIFPQAKPEPMPS